MPPGKDSDALPPSAKPVSAPSKVLSPKLLHLKATQHLRKGWLEFGAYYLLKIGFSDEQAIAEIKQLASSRPTHKQIEEALEVARALQ